MPKIVRSTDETIENNITGGLLPASGTTGQRPGTPPAGMIRFNTTIPGLEVFVGGAWSILAASSGLGSFVRRDGDTMTASLTMLDGATLVADNTGTAGAPAVSFDGDLDSGMFQSAANVVGIAGQGVVVALFDGSVALPINAFTFTATVTGAAPIFSNTGTDTNGVGLGLIIRGKTATAAGNGGGIVLDGGDGFTTGVGGALTFTAGDSAGATGTAGSVTIDAGAATGGAGGGVTLAGTNGTLTLGQTAFPITSTALGVLLVTAVDTLTDVAVTTGGSTVQLLQFNDTGDTFTWFDKNTLQGFSTITGDTGTALAELDDSLLLSGATNGGITTVASDNPEVVTFSITPIDLVVGSTITSADFMIRSAAADTATTIGQRVTYAVAFNDMGVPFTGGTLDMAQFLPLAGGTMTGALVVDDAGTAATPDLTWTGDLNTGLAQIGVADTLSIIGGGVEVTQFIGTVANVNFTTITSSATGVAPTISNAGTDTNGVGLGLILVGKAASAAGNGGPITITGGAGFTTGVGGDVLMTGGLGGASGAGGDVTIDGGSGGATSGNGGLIAFTAGDGTGAAAGIGGAITGNSGGSAAETAGTASASGAITFTVGQPGAATSGVGGAAGTISFVGATGGATSADTGVGGVGSAISLTAGTGGASDTGASSVGGAGGDVTITGGTGGSSTSGTGGVGGSVIIDTGTAGETDAPDGTIIMRHGLQPPLFSQAAPTTATGATTLTVAQTFGGILEGTPVASVSYTTRTGTEMDGDLTAHNVDDGFYLTIINLATATARSITLDTTPAGVSAVGDMVVLSATDGHSTGVFFFRNTVANTFIVYRVG